MIQLPGRHLLLSFFLLLAFRPPTFAQSLNDFFNDSVIQQISITVDPTDWATLLQNYEASTYYPATLTWGNITLTVGIKQHGSSSRSPIKPNLDVNISKYVKKQTFLGISEFILKANNEDPSNLHEWMAFKFFQKAGIPAPREGPAQFYVNGQLFGFYMAIEDMNDQFLLRNYGEDSGYFYEWEYLGLPPYYFTILGTDPSAYAPYLDLKSDQSSSDLANFANFINAVNNSTSSNIISNVSPYIDPALYLEYAAIENVISEKDGLWSDYEGTNNVYLYQFQAGTRYTLSPWDSDQTFSDPLRPIEQGAATNALARRLFAIPQYTQLYLATLATAAESFGGAGGWADTELTKEYNLIAAAAENDPHKQCLLTNPTTGACPANAFQDEVDNMHQLIATRQNFVLSQAALVGYEPLQTAPLIDDVSAQSSQDAELLPGTTALLTGENLGTAATATGASLPRILANTYVAVNGERAPLVSVSAGQVIFQMPSDLPSGAASVVAVVNGILSNAQDVYIAAPSASSSGLAINTTSLDFGSQKAVTWSAVQAVTITNATAANISVIAIRISGANVEDFYQSNDCGTTLNAGSACTVNMIFVPQLLGVRRAALLVTAGSSTQTIPLTGVGTAVGSFEIMNSLTGKVLDIASGSAVDGAGVQEDTIVGTQQQQWQLLPTSDGFYEVINNGTGKALDLTASSPADGASVQQWDYLGGMNQQWAFVPVDDVHYIIMNRASGKVLDLPDGSASNGTIAQQWDYLANPQQLWVLLPATSYTITNNLSGKVLDIPAGASSNGTLIQQYSQLGDVQQNWQLMPVGGGYYAVLNGVTGKVLDVQGESTADGAVIQEYDYLARANQQWQIVPVDSTNYLIVNRLSGKVLDNTGSSTSDGTYLQQWDYLAGANQQWQITAVQYYNIVNRRSGAALDLPGASSADPTAVQQWSLDGFPQQQWRLVAAANGYVGLVNKCTGQAIGPSNASLSDGALIEQQGYYRPNPSLQWLFTPLPGGYLEIINRLSGKVLDVQGQSTSSGAAIQQWDYLSGDNQQWQLIPVQN